MIKAFTLEKFGPLTAIHAEPLGPINLIIGANSSGKTFLLKALYAVLRAHEENGRGDEPRDFAELLSDKLYWIFQADSLGDLVQRGAGNRLKATLIWDDNASLAFEFGPDTSKKIQPSQYSLLPRDANSIFLPPKEVLSLARIILKAALQDRVFGFDATYVDLVLALQNPPTRGRNYDSFKQARQRLESMFQGKMEYDSPGEKWVYKKGNSRFSVNTTAEGIKKIAILDTLLGNRFLSPDSIVFIDEPESALHPTAISQLLDIIQILSAQGLQFFIASHSYYVVKKLYLIARQQCISIPVLSADDAGQWSQADLGRGIPDNAIINESIRLFEAELEFASL